MFLTEYVLNDPNKRTNPNILIYQQTKNQQNKYVCNNIIQT